MTDLPIHPFAELAPKMTDEEMDRLITDVRLHGIRDPIIMFEGMVLDGRNRLTAAARNQLTDSQLSFVNFEGTRREALELVMSKNIFRRHLNASQLAMVSARIHESIHEDPEFTTHRRWDDTLRSLRDLVTRQNRLGNVIWPPKEGFPPTAPETLKEFARKKGVKNVAIYPIGDDASFDNAAAIKESEDLGFAYLIPKDTPDPNKQTIDWDNQKAPSMTDNDLKSQTGDGATRDEFLGPQDPKNREAQTDENAGDAKQRGRPKGSSIDTLAAAAGVSRSMLKRALVVVREGSPELQRAVEQGHMSVKEAAEHISKPDKPENQEGRRCTTAHLRNLKSYLSEISYTEGRFVKTMSVSDAQEVLHLMNEAVSSIGKVLHANQGIAA